MNNSIIIIEDKEIRITNEDKMMWPKHGVTKLDYIKYLLQIAPYLLPYLQDRLLTTIRFPNGVEGKSFYQKNKPQSTPFWGKTYKYKDTDYLLANDKATLAFLGNLACLELHVSFHRVPGEEPAELVFDLDPSTPDFKQVKEVALYIKEELDQLAIPSWIKTSGASGLQVYVPLSKGHTFEATRNFSKIFAQYMAKKYPRLITIERSIKRRGSKVYFDYLQHWRGKTLIAPYSLRAKEAPYVSAPLQWEEVEQCHPENYTLFNMLSRINLKGDLFSNLLKHEGVNLFPILKYFNC